MFGAMPRQFAVISQLPSNTVANATAAVINTPWSENAVQKLVAAKLFQLIEWVYQAALLPPKLQSAEKILEVHGKCLRWYGEVCPFLEKNCDNSESPALPLSHPLIRTIDLLTSTSMLYQFCLICLFHNVSDLHFEGSYTVPTQIRREAAETLLRLSHSFLQTTRTRSIPASGQPSSKPKKFNNPTCQVSIAKGYSMKTVGSAAYSAGTAILPEEVSIARLPHVMMLITE